MRIIIIISKNPFFNQLWMFILPFLTFPWICSIWNLGGTQSTLIDHKRDSLPFFLLCSDSESEWILRTLFSYFPASGAQTNNAILRVIVRKKCRVLDFSFSFGFYSLSHHILPFHELIAESGAGKSIMIWESPFLSPLSFWLSVWVLWTNAFTFTSVSQSHFIDHNRIVSHSFSSFWLSVWALWKITFTLCEILKDHFIYHIWSVSISLSSIVLAQRLRSMNDLPLCSPQIQSLNSQGDLEDLLLPVSWKQKAINPLIFLVCFDLFIGQFIEIHALFLFVKLHCFCCWGLTRHF